MEEEQKDVHQESITIGEDESIFDEKKVCDAQDEDSQEKEQLANPDDVYKKKKIKDFWSTDLKDYCYDCAIFGFDLKNEDYGPKYRKMIEEDLDELLDEKEVKYFYFMSDCWMDGDVYRRLLWRKHFYPNIKIRYCGVQYHEDKGYKYLAEAVISHVDCVLVYHSVGNLGKRSMRVIDWAKKHGKKIRVRSV